MKLTLILPFLLLTGCGTVATALGGGDPSGYARDVPGTCNGKLAEIEELGGSVTAIRVARTIKGGAIAGIPIAVGVGFLNPAAALIPPAMAAFKLDDAGRQKRIDFLVGLYYDNGCKPLSSESP